MKKNVSGQKIGAQMISATDGSAFTGSVTVYVTGDAGIQAVGSVGSGACTHEGNGYHTYAPAQSETNYDLVAFTFIGTGAVPVTIQIFTSFPQTGDSYTEVAAIKAKTDNLPANPAATSDIPSAASIADAVWDEAISGHLTAGSTGNALNAAGSAGDPWATPLPGSYGAGTAGKIIGDNINATISSRATQTSVDAVDDFIDTEIAAIKSVVDAILDDTGTSGVIVATNNDKTGYAIGVGGIGATAFAAGAIDAGALAQDAAREIADEVLNRDLAGGSSGGTRNVRNALRALRNKQTISGGTLTIYQEDDTTSAWTASVTTAAGDPITNIDPA